MRLPFLLLFLSLGLAVAAVVTWRSSAVEALADPGLLRGLPDLPARFARDTEPAFEFSIEDLPQWQSDPVLVDKVGTYVDSRQFCHPDLIDLEPNADKGEGWNETALCGSFEMLPAGFFRQPPYLHLSGHSYVLLALRTDPARYGDVDWLTEHKAYLHVSELSEVARAGVRLTPAEGLVANLNEDDVRHLVAGTSLMLAGDRALIARGQSSEPAMTTYRAYLLETWLDFLHATPLVAAPQQDGDTCLAVIGTVCFNANPKGVERRLNQATVLGGGAIALLVGTVLLMGLRRVRSQRREQAARLFVLQTLSHEIRTPTTSLALSLEPIRRQFDDLPEGAQSAFLRICDNVQRLQRVVEASKQYLRGQVNGREIQFNRTSIPSVRDFVGGILEGYDREIALVESNEIAAVRLDPYWVSVCIRNLIDNAVGHGADPIAVLLSRQGGDLTVTVQDERAGSRLSFKEMTAPFSRAQTSHGLGLGLAVVKQLMFAMGGSLRYQGVPTRFSLVFRSVFRG